MTAAVPLNNPGAITSLFSAPKGWQRGGTSRDTRVEVMALPPKPA